jgi:hypothetical protein
MAKMIPDVPIAATESSAEREMFRLLKTELPDGFHVYHSVAFALSAGRHHAPHEGEIDFLIVHRELGMLAMEVKGGRIAYDGRQRVWTSTGRHGRNTIDDPFRQAEDFIHRLIREIKQRHIFGTALLDFAYGYCVAFPDCRYEPSDVPPQCPTDLVIDAGKLPQLKDWITRIMAQRAGEGGKQAMTRQQMKLLAQRVLAPRFELGLSLEGEFAWEERALRLLTAEQALCLDFLALNPRAVVHGPAGTGKTLLALEHARRTADEGARVALLCFNLPLAKQLHIAASSMEGLTGSIWAGAYHELCQAWAAKAALPFEIPAESNPAAMSKFWDEESSLILADAVGKLSDRFDVLIVDEAQDMHELWWQVLLDLLADSKRDGLVLLYDPEQNIYGRDGSLPLEKPVFPLRLNCRSTHPIGQYTSRLAGVPCRTPIFVGGGEEPRVTEYRNPEEQYEKISNRLKDLLAAGVQPGQIVLLGPRRIERSFLGQRCEIGGLPIVLFDEHTEAVGDALRYSTLHRFKGLEADVVLLCDVDGNPHACTRRHVYVAASRAKHRLYIFACADALRENPWIRDPDAV